MRLAICYVSNSNLYFTEEEIKELLVALQEKYEHLYLKGIFLYSEGNIFQIIEGEEKEVLTIWEEKRKDKRHKNLIKIFEEKITTPPFDGYLCEYISEEDKYDHDYIKKLFDQLKSLDEKPRKAATEILKLFLKCQ